MKKGEIVGNIIVIDFKYKGSLQYFQYKYLNHTYVQDRYCKMEIVESIIFCQFGYPIFEDIFTLDT
jgi:hypothetical protein